jgi:hypothetical protein
MKEIWKNIIDFEEYQISNLGRIKRKNVKDRLNHLRKEKFLKQYIIYNSNKHEYLRVLLQTKNKKKKSMFIHRLIALHFISNPENKLQVNHKDGLIKELYVTK